jgi:hypothetical protein
VKIILQQTRGRSLSGARDANSSFVQTAAAAAEEESELKFT